MYPKQCFRQQSDNTGFCKFVRNATLRHLRGVANQRAHLAIFLNGCWQNTKLVSLPIFWLVDSNKSCLTWGQTKQNMENVCFWKASWKFIRVPLICCHFWSFSRKASTELRPRCEERELKRDGGGDRPRCADRQYLRVRKGGERVWVQDVLISSSRCQQQAEKWRGRVTLWSSVWWMDRGALAPCLCFPLGLSCLFTGTSRPNGAQCQSQG